MILAALLYVCFPKIQFLKLAEILHGDGRHDHRYNCAGLADDQFVGSVMKVANQSFQSLFVF